MVDALRGLTGFLPTQILQPKIANAILYRTVESMFKDFCGFKIASFEKRLSLGIEIVLCEPNKYFAHRKSSVAGMAYFDIAKNTLYAVGLNCPIWLIGIKE